MHKVNNKLIQYCKDNDFPTDEMGKDYFKLVENSFGYQRYLLAYAMLDIKREIIKPFEVIAIYIINKIDNLLR